MKIIVHPLLPTGNFLNCRIGVERDYPDDFSLEEAINIEWNNLIAIHMKRYPHLYNGDGTAKYEMYKGEDEMKGTKVRDVVEPIDSVNPSIKAIMEEIEGCTKISEVNGKGVEIGLMAYAMTVEKYPELNEVYLKQLEKLGGIQNYNK